MKTLYMESTKKEPEETIQEIMILLRNYKVRDVLTNYDDKGKVKSMSFTLDLNNQIIPFQLPVDHLPLWEMSIQKRTRYINNEDQARRVAWRQVYKWIQSQLAMVDIKMVKFEQVFMPYIMINHKETIYDHYLRDGNMKLLKSVENEET